MEKFETFLNVGISTLLVLCVSAFAHIGDGIAASNKFEKQYRAVISKYCGAYEKVTGRSCGNKKVKRSKN